MTLSTKLGRCARAKHHIDRPEVNASAFHQVNDQGELEQTEQKQAEQKQAEPPSVVTPDSSHRADEQAVPEQVYQAVERVPSYPGE